MSKILKIAILLILVGNSQSLFLVSLGLNVLYTTLSVAVTVSVGVAVTGAAVVAKAKGVFFFFEAFTFHKQVEGIVDLSVLLGEISEEVYGDELLTQKLNSDLEKYRDFQKASTDVCSTFLLKSIKSVIYKPTENVEEITKFSVEEQKQNLLKKKESIKTFKNPQNSDEYFVLFNQNEFININDLEEGKSITTIVMDEVKDEVKKELTEEAKEKLYDEGTSLIIKSIVGIDLSSLQNLGTKYQNFKEGIETIQLVKNRDYGTLANQALNSYIENVKTSLSESYQKITEYFGEKYNYYFNPENEIKETDLKNHFLCSINYVLFVKTDGIKVILEIYSLYGFSFKHANYERIKKALEETDVKKTEKFEMEIKFFGPEEEVEEEVKFNNDAATYLKSLYEMAAEDIYIQKNQQGLILI